MGVSGALMDPILLIDTGTHNRHLFIADTLSTLWTSTYTRV